MDHHWNMAHGTRGPTVDGSEIPNNHRLGIYNPVNPGRNYQPQLVSLPDFGHKFKPSVGKYTSPMDPMGYGPYGI